MKICATGACEFRSIIMEEKELLLDNLSTTLSRGKKKPSKEELEKIQDLGYLE